MQGKRAKPAVNTQAHKLPPHLCLSSFSKQACILSGKRISLLPPSPFSLCKSPSLPSPFFCCSILPSKDSSPQPTPSSTLCLNSFGPREQTKKGLCPGRKRWCVTLRGDNASAGSTQSQALSLSFSVCLSLINYLQFTFTKS